MKPVMSMAGDCSLPPTFFFNLVFSVLPFEGSFRSLHRRAPCDIYHGTRFSERKHFDYYQDGEEKDIRVAAKYGA